MSDETPLISKNDAEQLATAINLLFNNSVFFGAGHPSIVAASADLAEKVKAQANAIPMVTLAKTGESFYIEKWCVDHRLNATRTLTHFQRCGIESISFTPEVEGLQIQLFLQFYEDALEKSQSAASINHALEAANNTTVLVNYITFQQVTKDQQVIGSGQTVGDAVHGSIGEGINKEALDSTVFNRLNQLFSFNDVMASGSVSDTFVQMISGDENGPQASGHSYGLPNLTDQFKKLRINIDQGELPLDEEITYDQLFESLIELNSALKNNQEIQERLIKLDSSESFVSEVDALTYDATLAIVREEYKKENPSIRRLAYLIKRISPSQLELRRLMPRLKETLLDEGMNISHFLELSIEIEREFSADSALQALFTQSDDYGVDRDELINAIKSTPGETAKILLQAAEIEKKVEGHDVNISNYLGQMINDVAKATAEEKIQDMDGSGKSIHAILSNVVETVEHEIMGKMREESKGEDISDDIQKQLQRRFPKTLERLKSEWVINTLTNTDTMTHDGLVSMVNSVVHDTSEIETYKDALEMFSGKYGMSSDEIAGVLAAAKQQKILEGRKKDLPLLPPKTTVHFIKRYIEEYRRYNHPFGIVIISDFREDVKYAGDILLTLSESVSLMMTEQFRLLDITGFLRFRGKDFAVVILPMTGKKGLASLLNRMTLHLGQQAHSELCISSLYFEEPMKPLTYEEAMKQLLQDHVKEA